MNYFSGSLLAPYRVCFREVLVIPSCPTTKHEDPKVHSHCSDASTFSPLTKTKVRACVSLCQRSQGYSDGLSWSTFSVPGPWTGISRGSGHSSCLECFPRLPHLKRPRDVSRGALPPRLRGPVSGIPREVCDAGDSSDYSMGKGRGQIHCSNVITSLLFDLESP